MVPSEAPKSEAVLEPLWGPALAVCMLVSLAVFIAALFAARAGAQSHVEHAGMASACATTHDLGTQSFACTRHDGHP
jgi:hypothetical protein